MQYPSSFCVPATVSSQLKAVRRLVSPAGLSKLAASMAVQTGSIGVADPVAAWMRGLFYAGTIRYINDPQVCGVRDADLWRSPANTLANGGGDCEDLAILGASALMAFRVSDVWIVVGDVPAGRHAWIEGADGISGFLLDGTSQVLVRQQRPAGYRPEYSYHPTFGARIWVQGAWQPLAA